MGGSTSGKGATTSSSAPPGQAMQSYEGLMHRANQLSNQPYNPYTGQLVANLTPQQQQAFSEYGNAYGAAQPYIDQAAAYGSLGASPIQASQIQNYLNPYQQDVIGATESQMNNIDAAQLAQTQGQGMGAGGLFNDRLGVAQGQVANQQALANNQTLAGLNVQNYSQALAAAQADRAAAAQGAYTFGNLGQENLQSILAGAGANLQAGNAQQQQQQNVLNSTYGQWQQAQAYPYQQIGWAAGIDTGLGSNMGGQSSTQPGAPNPISQYGGLALTAAGMGYNMNQGTPAFSKRGGRIRGFDAGGATPYGAGASWIPNVQITHGSGPPKPPGAPQQQAGQMPKMPGGVGKGSAGAGTAASGTSIAGEAGDALGSFGDMVGGATAAGDVGDFAALALLANKGGRVDVGRPRGLEWGHGIRGYADGGAPDDEPVGLGSGTPWGGIDSEAFSPQDFGHPQGLQYPTAGEPDPKDPGFNPVRGDSGSRVYYDPGDNPTRDGLHRPLDVPDEPASSLRGPGGVPDNGTAPDGLHRPLEPLPGRQDRAEASLGDIPRVAPPQQSRGNGIGNALMAAGLSLMANRSPYLGPALGEAGLAGLSSYTGEQHHQEQQEHLATKEKLDQEKADRQLKMLQEQEKRADRTAAETHRHNTATEEHQAGLLAQGKTPPGMRLNNGKLENIPGYEDALKGQATAKRPTGTAFDDNTVKVMADAIQGGNPNVLVNLGAGAQKAENVAKVWNEIARRVTESGGSGTDINAARANFMAQMGAAKSQATRAANVEANIEEARQTFPLAIEASRAAWRTGFVPLNKAVQMVQAGTGSPELRRFTVANAGAITAYSQAMARSGVATVDGRHAAEALLMTADSPQAYEAALDQMEKEMHAAAVAPETVRQGILSRISGRPAPAGEASAPAAAPSIPPPAQRQVGKAYTNQRGQSATWTGTGWQASP